MREENVKHFRLPDGSMIAAQYDTAVHYRDESGTWQNIDNTLSYDILSHEYKTENDFFVAFPLVSGGNTLLALRDGKRHWRVVCG